MSLKVKSKTVVESGTLYTKEKLPIAAYRSSKALKNEIRRIMNERRAEHWDFCGLKTCGALISLCFKRSLNLTSSETDDCSCLQCA